MSQKSIASMDKTTRGKRIGAIALGLGILALIGWAVMPKPTPADFGEIVRGPLQVTIDEEGETRVRDRFTVSAPVAGRVLRIELEPGDTVTAGETVLAVFQPSEPQLLDARSRREAEARVGAAEAALGEARAQRDRAVAELRFAERDRERYTRLAEEEVVAASRLDMAELEEKTRTEALQAAELAVRRAEKDLDAARAVLLQASSGVEKAGGLKNSGQPITLRSPIDGVVLRRLRESESIVPAGEPLLEIADPSRLEIVTDLLSSDAVQVDIGDRVLLEQWGGEEVLEARVRRVEPYGFTKFSALGVEEQRVNVILDFADPHGAWERLGDGYRVEVRIVVWQADDIVKAPTSSLFRIGEGWGVFVVEGAATEDGVVQGGVARKREVEIGRRTGLEAQIVGGVEAGDVVVLHPSDELEDGMEVVRRGV